MPKIKTHSATKKRFHLTATGKVSYKKCGRSHLLSSKNAKRLRSLKKVGILPANVEGHIKKMLPYA
ncbi:MAG: 50S ribosomal protein L35 [Synergistaceae bacterium]|nr:50S ribosomal protein L35 [Synergistaceae bacterium]